MNKPPFPRTRSPAETAVCFLFRRPRAPRAAQRVHSGPQRPLVHIGIAQHHGGGRTVLRVLHIIGGTPARAAASTSSRSVMPLCTAASRCSPVWLPRTATPSRPKAAYSASSSASRRARQALRRRFRCRAKCPSSIKRHSVCCSNRDTVEEYTPYSARYISSTGTGSTI